MTLQGKVLVRLAREPDDDVGRERDRGHLSPELCNEVEKFISGVIARHLVEHLRGTRLQAQVEMPADAAIRGGKRRDQRRFQALRLDRRDAQTPDSRALQQDLHQVGQIEPVVVVGA